MLKKVIFAAALSLGFVTSFQVGRGGAVATARASSAQSSTDLRPGCPCPWNDCYCRMGLLQCDTQMCANN